MEIFIPYFPLVLCIAGALVYALATNARAVELGRILFGVSLLVWLLKVTAVKV